MPNGLSAALPALDRPISDKEILDLIKITGQLNVWACTWNMHAKSWPENLRKELNVSDKNLFESFRNGILKKNSIQSKFLGRWKKNGEKSKNNQFLEI